MKSGQKLFKEIFNTGARLTVKEQENDCYILTPTNCVEATQEEIEQAEKVYKEKGVCDYHLIYDEPCWIYDERICGICGKHVAMI